MIFMINVFALIDRVISSYRKMLININVNSLLLFLIALIKRFKIFKKRVKSKLKTVARDALFK